MRGLLNHNLLLWPSDDTLVESAELWCEVLAVVTIMSRLCFAVVGFCVLVGSVLATLSNVGEWASYKIPGTGIAAVIMGAGDKLEVMTDPGSVGIKWSSSCHVFAECSQFYWTRILNGCLTFDLAL